MTLIDWTDARKQFAPFLADGRSNEPVLDPPSRGCIAAAAAIGQPAGAPRHVFRIKDFSSPHHRPRASSALHAANRTNLDLDSWMRAAQTGDNHAYGRLLRAVMPLLRRYIQRHHGDWPAADIEDVAQDTLLSMHVVRATYDPRRPFLPWLFAIARYRTADAARRRVQRSAIETSVAPLPDSAAHDGASFSCETRAEIDVVRRALNGLAPNQRMAIELVKLRELSLKEAAAAMGLSIAALKVTLHRAIRALRATLVPKLM